MQQQTSNVVLVQQQPQAVVTTVHHGYAPGDQGMVLAVISTFVVVFFFCWFSLICTIPAIIFASNAQSSATVGDADSAKQNRYLSYGLSITGLTTGVAAYLAWIIYVIVLVTAR